MNRGYVHLALAFIFLALACVAYGFWYHALSLAGDRVALLTEQAAQMRAHAAAANAAGAELSSLAATGSAIESYFIAEQEVVGFLEGLQKTGSALGADVSIVSVSTASSTAPHLDLSLSIAGSFDAVMKTLGAIEYGPYDLTVKNLTISATPADENAAWSAELSVSLGTRAGTKATP